MVRREAAPWVALILVTGLVAVGCFAGGEDPAASGLAAESGGLGPRVRFEPLLRPTPEVPFPSDLMLTPSDETPSGLAWNLSKEEPSEHANQTRAFLNELDGFGVYGPAVVSFDGRLDLSTVTEASALIVNIEPGHPREGEVAPLDLNRGFFPSNGDRNVFFGQDPGAGNPSLVFPLENTADLDGDGVEEPIVHYEVSSNTLLLRPILPLAQKARHAVLLTTAMRGWGPEMEADETPQPIRSPFAYKAHAAQSEHVLRALDLAVIEPTELAYGWVYTTGDLATPLLNIRAGVRGEGPLAKLSDAAPPGISEIRDTGVPEDVPDEERDHRYRLSGVFFNKIMGLVNQFSSNPIDFTFDNVDYIVFGSMQTPDTRTGPRETFGLNPHTGVGEVGTVDVPMLIAIPKTTEQHKPPFPVLFYFHGTSTSRVEALGVADIAAKHGIATVGFDQVAHGPFFPDVEELLFEDPAYERLAVYVMPVLAKLLDPALEEEVRGLDAREGLKRLQEVGIFAELTIHGRAVDFNGDGQIESSEGFFHADPVRQCSSFWQDLADFWHVSWTVRSFRQSAVPPALEDPRGASIEELMPSLLAGDFDADGVLDLGGPDVPFYMAGTSLGGFHSALAAALEPETVATVPMVAGGGLADIMVRSDMFSVTQQLFLEVFGQVLVGCPDGEGNVWISFGDDTGKCRRNRLEERSFARLDAAPAGAVVKLSNLTNGELTTTEVNEEGGFALGVECDIGDQLRLEVDPDGEEPQELEVEARRDGVGHTRGTPELRRAIGIQQHVLDRCDPIAFARNLFWDPLPGHDPVHVLMLQSAGDITVPAAAGVNLALAAGMFGRERADWEPIAQAIIDSGTMERKLYDLDDLRRNNPPEQPPVGPLTPVKSGDGVSSVRWADVDRHHEWVLGHTKDGFRASDYGKHRIGVFLGCDGRAITDGDLECFFEGAEPCPQLDDLSHYPGCLREE